jgi:hypothetical protein
MNYAKLRSKFAPGCPIDTQPQVATRTGNKRMYQNAAPQKQDAFAQDRTLKSKNKPANCPWCGSHRIAIVLGGMPVYIPEFEKELDEGQAGAHAVSNSPAQPSWQCTECGAQFFRDLQLVNHRD